MSANQVMPCFFENSFLESERFLAYSLHALTSLELPIHAVGAYLIIFKTPATMGKAKIGILQLLCFCVIMDLMITSLLCFYHWIPSPSGYPVGLMTTFGVESSVQVFLTVSSMIAVGISYISLFENRYDAIVIGLTRRSKYRNFFRALYFCANVIYAETTPIYIFWNLPSQEEGRIAVYESVVCIPKSHVENSYFIHLNVESILIPRLTATMLFIFSVQCFYFVFYTISHLFFNFQAMSQQTRKLQQQFFISTLLQVFIPIVAYIAPLLYCFIAWHSEYYNQVFNNLAMIAVGSNGLFATIVMIIVHHPYRVAVKEWILTRNKS